MKRQVIRIVNIAKRPCLHACILPAGVPVSTAQTLTISATGDNTVDIFHDGAIVQHDSWWGSAVTAPLPGDTCVLALTATNNGGAGGLLASTSTGVVTDETWKCSGTEQQGWHLEEFNDTCWSSAHVVAQYGDGPWGAISGISGNAKWIWDIGYVEYTVATTYCRKTICVGQ